jgi:hypothetical protein
MDTQNTKPRIHKLTHKLMSFASVASIGALLSFPAMTLAAPNSCTYSGSPAPANGTAGPYMLCTGTSSTHVRGTVSGGGQGGTVSTMPSTTSNRRGGFYTGLDVVGPAPANGTAGPIH